MRYPIADLHGDLLCYLAGDRSRSAYDSKVRCSIPHLLEGQVKLQILPIFTETNQESTEKGQKQAAAYQSLPKVYPGEFVRIHHTQELARLPETAIGILPAIENASAFFTETEPFEEGWQRFETFLEKVKHLLYVSLTWNTENRFGGGASTKTGLKEDGKLFLRKLAGKGIAVDLSHASDFLADDILNLIDQANLDLAVIASHSNFRKIKNVSRNLPDFLAKEILRRQGIIGINFYCPFVGEKAEDLARHVEHLLELGGESQGCFGADYFCMEDLSPEYRRPESEMFFSGYDTSGSYPNVLRLLKEKLLLEEAVLRGFASENLLRFISKSLDR